MTLEKRGLVEFDHVAQLWHIGPRAFVIGARFIRRTNLVERARPIMRKLMEATGETANLGIQQEGSVLFLSQVETQASIRAFFPPGTLSPMHASGIGKALLAHMDDVRLEKLLRSEDFEQFTDHSITDPVALKTHLIEIRSKGYSVDNEEKTQACGASQHRFLISMERPSRAFQCPAPQAGSNPRGLNSSLRLSSARRGISALPSAEMDPPAPIKRAL